MAGRVQRDLSGAHGALVVDLSSTDQVLPAGCRGVLIGTAGDIKVDFVSFGTGITLTGLGNGREMAMQISKIYRTGTTATNIVALY